MSKTVEDVEEQQAQKTDVAYVDIAHFLNALVDLMIRKSLIEQTDVDELWRAVMADQPQEYFKSKADIYDDAKANASTPVVPK